MSNDEPPSVASCAEINFRIFSKQKRRLSDVFSGSIKAEVALLGVSDFDKFCTTHSRLERVLSREIRWCNLRSPHLFSTTYSGTYFGVLQAVEIDSIVATLRSRYAAKLMTSDERRWCEIALGRALLKIANSTGHFAQHLQPKRENYTRYLALRRRSVWTEWLNSLAEMSPVGSASWRKRNRVFNQDSLALIPSLKYRKLDISVVYADPPYTDDQYSRFYHVLETLLLYDYPSVTGSGLYRSGRFHTPFSVKTKAARALYRFIEAAAGTGADLVLSYPQNGLAVQAGADVKAVLRKFFRRVEACQSISHSHSTFGASKGVARSATTELIYLARSA